MKNNKTLAIRVLILDDQLFELSTKIRNALSDYVGPNTVFPNLSNMAGNTATLMLEGLSVNSISLTIICNKEEDKDAAVIKNNIENGEYSGFFDLVLVDDKWDDGETAGRDILLQAVDKNIKGLSPELPIISLFTRFLNRTRLKNFYEVLLDKVDNWERVLPRDKSDELQLIDLLQRTIVAKKIVVDKLKISQEKDRLRAELDERCPRPDGMAISVSRQMRSVYQHIKECGQVNSAVLILGESGVGKELVANAIHAQSNRKNNPFIKFSLPSLSDNIIESEFFGHEKGAFTGAVKAHKGRFERANTGTIFLDEVGDLPLTLQVKLLRILQEKEFERVGGSETIKVDVRVIAATNLDLLEMIRKGMFREDLYYRLNVLPITVPPLRDRKEDIPELVKHFIRKHEVGLQRSGLGIADDAVNKLCSYSWPGNVRELENYIERALARCLIEGSKIILSEHIPEKDQKINDLCNASSQVSFPPGIDMVKAGKAVDLLNKSEDIAIDGGGNIRKRLELELGNISASAVTQQIMRVSKEMREMLIYKPNAHLWLNARPVIFEWKYIKDPKYQK